MPTMSVDFSITQIYRLVANDLLMMFDALVFYRKFKRNGRTIKEFSEVLANMVEVESENFDEIRNINKLCHGEKADLSIIIWDYFHDIVMKHILDDFSQYPFWAAKIVVTTQPQVFGLPVIQAWCDSITTSYIDRGAVGLFQGLGPYLVASVIINYKYVFKSTNEFVQAVLAKIPHNHSTLEQLQSDAASVVAAATATPVLSGASMQLHHQQLMEARQNQAGQDAVTHKQLVRSSATAPMKPKRSGSKAAPPKESVWMAMAANALVSVLSHPFLTLSVNMVTQPALKGSYWFSAYVKLVASGGLRSLYRGVRTRAFLCMLPLSPILLLGVSDAIMYRRMLGQGTSDSTGGLISVLREMVSKEGGGSLSVLNYGLLTLVQIVPGFLSFVGMRSLSRMLFGSSQQRKHQVNRRKEIVESHLNIISKKLAHSDSSGNNASGEATAPPVVGGISRSRSAHFELPPR